MRNKIEMKADWSQVTLEEFIKIDNIRKSNIAPERVAIQLVSILTGWKEKELEQLPISIVKKLTDSLDFLSTEVPKISMKKEYILNKHKYKPECKAEEISTAKYFDYTNVSKIDKEVVEDNIYDNFYLSLISLWLVPKGHKYDDGYDMESVKDDLLQIKMIDFQAIVNFQLRQFAAFVLVSADCLKKTMEMEKKLEVKKNQELLTHLNNMAFSLWSLGAVN